MTDHTLKAPLSAYVHVPFCKHRCGYCNFSVVEDRLDLERAFLDALATEIAWLGPSQEVTTRFIGGGTPTELSPGGLKLLCEMIDKWFPGTHDCEYTCEANPDSLTAERLDILVEHGVNRISIGGQSFDPAKLKNLDRQHSVDQVHAAIELATSRIQNVSLDLIFAAPNESLYDWQHDLQIASSMPLQHISTYGLTFEKGTAFWNAREQQSILEVDEDVQRQMYELAIDYLIESDFDHYEVSNFAKPGYRCRHNQTYWTGRPFYGVGPGAARYLGGVRETNHRSTTAYIKQVSVGDSPVHETEVLTAEQRARERLVFGLRRLDGVDAMSFYDSTGFTIETLAGSAVARASALGLMDWDEVTLRLTRKGLLVSDSLWPDFLD